jgi:hypothetical protein
MLLLAISSLFFVTHTVAQSLWLETEGRFFKYVQTPHIHYYVTLLEGLATDNFLANLSSLVTAVLERRILETLAETS